jgi:hypothetical protein
MVREREREKEPESREVQRSLTRSLFNRILVQVRDEDTRLRVSDIFALSAPPFKNYPITAHPATPTSSRGGVSKDDTALAPILLPEPAV